MTCFLGEVLSGETLEDGEPLWWPDAAAASPTNGMPSGMNWWPGRLRSPRQTMGLIR